jgi:thiol-disulfide isomerase/thioredoxin
MKKTAPALSTLLFFTFLLTSKLSAQTAKGIDFIQDNFSQALKQAEKENKIIFFDAYTTWCGPCKMMNRSTFSNPKVAAFYNSGFVNLKLDMEAGEGPELMQRYNISAFPTLLFLNSKGEVVHKALGFHDADQFLLLGETALSGDKSLSSVEKRYQKGERSPEFLKAFAVQLAEAYDPRRTEIALSFLKTQTDWNTPENLEFIYRFTESADSPLFEYLLKNRPAFEKQFKATDIDLKIQDLTAGFLFNEKDVPTLTAADSLIAQVYPKTAARMQSFYRLSHARMKGDRAGYAQSALVFFDKYADSGEELGEAAATFEEQIDDKSQLKAATKWAKKAIKLENIPAHYETLAKLYKKLDSHSKALKALKKGIALAQKTGQNTAESEALYKAWSEKN